MTDAVAAGPPRAPAMLATQSRRRASKVREFITPEGVDLRLEIASAGLRFGALTIDLTLMIIILIVVSLILGAGMPDNQARLGVVVWLFGFFVLRNGWFTLFELGRRAATPGKRLCGIRVVARDGGRLEVSSVVARNFVREVEMFLPIYFVTGLADGEAFDWATALLGAVWTFAMSLFLLFNKDRMRLGDLIGGTWVVMGQRRRIAADLSTAVTGVADTIIFSPAELAAYGVYELQELERVLRLNDAATTRSVADAIRTKFDRPIAEFDEDFLNAYYRQAKARMERDLLFGKRRANKYEDAA
jgi:uncharacterized RDD family membrane protein YckC